MPLQLFGHPFSSYVQKVLIALYANDTPFELRMLSPDHPENAAEHARLWPLKRMPLLVDGDRVVPEATIVIEHLGIFHPGPVALVPSDAHAALDVRMVDRFFDNYVQTPMQKIVFDGIRAEGERDPRGVADARAMLATAYRWLDERMAGREWAAGSAPTLADCAAAPALFYTDWVQPIDETLANARAYRRRLLAWKPFARAVDEARPYRALFPLGAPDRD